MDGLPQFDWQVDVDAQSAATIESCPTGYRIKVGQIQGVISADGDLDLYFGTNNAAGRVGGAHLKGLKAGSGIATVHTWNQPGAVNTDLKIATSAGTFSGTIGGWFVK